MTRFTPRRCPVPEGPTVDNAARSPDQKDRRRKHRSEWFRQMVRSSVETGYLVGLDDTDNLESRGTGYRARQLRGLLEEHGLADVEAVTRHQLLVSPLIPYTSHNSAACLALEAHVPVAQLHAFCGEYLATHSAPGSDAGLCIAAVHEAGDAVREFGRRAQREVLSQDDARRLAAQEALILSGYTGDHGGVIGALAAVGLRAGQSDGRFLWLEGIREWPCGCHQVAELLEHTGIDDIRCYSGRKFVSVDADDFVDVTWTLRPVLLDGEAILLVERNDEHQGVAWRSAPRAVVKRY